MWVVIGEGPLRLRLEALARAAGLDGAVCFLGAVPDAERDRWLRRADVFAMLSRLPGEGFGIAYLEAGARGKPVLAGNLGGPRGGGAGRRQRGARGSPRRGVPSQLR